MIQLFESNELPSVWLLGLDICHDVMKCQSGPVFICHYVSAGAPVFKSPSGVVATSAIVHDHDVTLAPRGHVPPPYIQPTPTRGPGWMQGRARERCDRFLGSVRSSDVGIRPDPRSVGS